MELDESLPDEHVPTNGMREGLMRKKEKERKKERENISRYSYLYYLYYLVISKNLPCPEHTTVVDDPNVHVLPVAVV